VRSSTGEEVEETSAIKQFEHTDPAQDPGMYYIYSGVQFAGGR
jgi:hypothetical protein